MREKRQLREPPLFDSSADIPRHACPVEQLVPIIGRQEVRLRRSRQHVRAQEPKAAGGKYARRTKITHRASSNNWRNY